MATSNMNAGTSASSSGNMIPDFFVPKQRRSRGVLIVGGSLFSVIAVVGIAAFLLSRCLTFYAFMLPQDDYSIVYGVNHANATKNVSEAAVGALLSSEALAHTQTFNQYVYAKSDTKEIVIGVRAQSGNIFERVYKTLRAGVIDIQYIAGMREQVAISKPFVATFNTFKWSFQNRTYMSPTIIAYVQSGELLQNPTPISLVIKERQEATSFAYQSTPQFQLPEGEGVASVLPDKEIQYVAIPSNLLALLPAEISAQIESQFLPLSGLTSSNVSLASALESADSFALLKGHDGGAVALGGAASEQLVMAWVASEYGKNHPVTESFTLPDGTRGFEVVPEQVVSEIFSDTSKPGCRSVKVNGQSLTTCQVGEWSVIGKHESTVFQLSDLVSNISPQSIALHVPLPTPNGGGVVPTHMAGNVLTYTGTATEGVGQILHQK